MDTMEDEEDRICVDDVNAQPLRYQITYRYTHWNDENVFTFDKFQQARELLDSRAGWLNKNKDEHHADNKRHLWCLPQSPEMVYFAPAFQRLISCIRSECAEKLDHTDWCNWQQLFDMCPDIMEVAVKAYNTDAGYTSTTCARDLHYYVRIGKQVDGVEEPVTVDHDTGRDPSTEVWIRIGRSREIGTINNMSVFMSCLRGNMHLSGWLTRPFLCNDEMGHDQLRRFRSITLEKGDLKSGGVIAWNAVFKQQRILQNHLRAASRRSTPNAEGIYASQPTSSAAGTITGEEAPTVISRVYIGTHSVLRGPRKRQHPDAENENPQGGDGDDDEAPSGSTLICNFGFRQIMTSFKYIDEADRPQRATLMQVAHKEEGADTDDEELAEVLLKPEDTCRSIDLQKAVQNNAGMHFSCIDMKPSEFQQVFSKLWTAYVASGGRNQHLVTQFGLQVDSSQDFLDMNTTLYFVFENYVVDYRKGYGACIVPLAHAGFKVDKAIFRRITCSGMSASGFPNIRCMNFEDRYNGNTDYHRANRRAVLHNVLYTSIRFYGHKNACSVIWVLAMAWAGLSYSEWHAMDKCFPVTYVLSTQNTVGKTTCLYQVAAAIGLNDDALNGSGTTVSGCLDYLNAVCGIAFIMDDFQSEQVNNENNTNKWKETLKAMHDSNTIMHHNRTRKTRSCAILSANSELHSHDEPLQSRLFTVEFFKVPRHSDVTEYEYKNSYRDISCLIPEILGMKHKGKLDERYISELEMFLRKFTDVLMLPSRVAKHLKKPLYYLLLVFPCLLNVTNPRNADYNSDNRAFPNPNDYSDEDYSRLVSYPGLVRTYIFDYIVDVQLKRYWGYIQRQDMWQKFLESVRYSYKNGDRKGKFSIHHHNYREETLNYDGGSVVVGEGVKFCCLVMREVFKVCNSLCPDALSHMSLKHLENTNPEGFDLIRGKVHFWGGGLPITITHTEGDESHRTSVTHLLPWEDVLDGQKMIKDCIMIPKSVLFPCGGDDDDPILKFDQLKPDYQTITIRTKRRGVMEDVCLYDEVVENRWPGKRVFPDADGPRNYNEDDDEDGDDEDDDDSDDNDGGNDDDDDGGNDADDDDDDDDVGGINEEYTCQGGCGGIITNGSQMCSRCARHGGSVGYEQDKRPRRRHVLEDVHDHMVQDQICTHNRLLDATRVSTGDTTEEEESHEEFEETQIQESQSMFLDLQAREESDDELLNAAMNFS